MGDVLLTTPCIRMLKVQLGAIVHILTKSVYLDIFESNRYVDQIFRRECTSLYSLRSESYDLVLDLQKNLRSVILRVRLGVRVVSYNKRSVDKWLYLLLGVNHLNRMHVAETYIQSLERLGIKDDMLGLDIAVSKEHSDIINMKDGSRPLIVISMGGTYITKRIPIGLIKGISYKKEYDYVLIGGADVHLEESKLPEQMINLIGKTSLKETIQQIDQSDIVITGDTGTMHIAAALQKPIIVIWGSTSAEFGFYPYYGKKSAKKFTSIEQKDLACRPCSKYGRKKCPKGHMNCLNRLQPSELEREIEVLVRSSPDSTFDIY